MFFGRLCVAGAFSRNKYALGHHNSAQKREWPGTVITFLDRVRDRYNSKKGRQNCSNPPEKETEYRQTAQRNGGSETLRSLSARRVLPSITVRLHDFSPNYSAHFSQAVFAVSLKRTPAVPAVSSPGFHHR